MKKWSELRPMESLGNAAKNHQSRRGAFSAGLTALAVAAVILFNLLIAQIPAAKMQIDLTNSKIYNITDTSVQYLNGMTKDVDIHVLADESTMDTRIVRFLDKYVSLSDHLKLDYINPTVYPSVLSKYNVDADTIVVTCADTDRQETIPIDNIIGYDQMAYYYNGTYTETNFDCEGLLTSAIDGVLTDASRAVYETTGHNETTLPLSVEALFKKVHMSVTVVNLLKQNGIPDDCDLLILNDPTKDLSDAEKAMVLDYLKNGGQVIYNMAAQLNSLPNLDDICKTYGMTVTNGFIADTKNYYNSFNLFFPTVDNNVDAAASVTSDSTVLFYNSRGMTMSTPTRSTITASPFLTTSDKSYNVVDEKDQTEGTYVVGAVATETTSDNTTARLTVFGSDSLVNEQILNTFTNVANTDLFMSAATVGFGDISKINITPVSLQDPTNTITAGGIWAILYIFVLPVAALVFGFVRWMRRRKL